MTPRRMLKSYSRDAAGSTREVCAREIFRQMKADTVDEFFRTAMEMRSQEFLHYFSSEKTIDDIAHEVLINLGEDKLAKTYKAATLLL